MNISKLILILFKSHLFWLYSLLALNDFELALTEGVYSGQAYDALSVGDGGELYQQEKQNFTYHKCFCDIQEVWSRGSCIGKGTDAIAPLLQELQPESEILFNYVFSSVKINDVNCSGGAILVELGDDGGLYLIDNGELYSESLDLVFSEGDYCVEFVEEGELIRTIARVCTPPPVIPYCFAEELETKYLKLPMNISYSTSLVAVDQVDVVQAFKPPCDDDHHLTLSLKNTSVNLSFVYISGNVEVLWTPPVSKIPQVKSLEEYCIAKAKDNLSYEVQLCYEDPIKQHHKLCESSVCVRKCCPDHHLYHSMLRTCVKEEMATNSTLLQFYNFQNKSEVNAPENLLMEYSFPWCSPERLYVIDPVVNSLDKFFLLENGSLYISLSEVITPPSLYCVELFTDGTDAITSKAISCFTENSEHDDQCKNVHRILYPVLIVISCIFLGITLIVYAVIPELHSKLHGKSLLSHVFSLLLAFLCQLVVSWSSKSLSMNGCKLIALGNQVSFLWAFFWLNVMCFDIWWTLRTMSLVPETGESSRRRFTLYSAYAWGVPLVICLFTALMEFLPGSVDKAALILPGFGVRGCWFQDVKSTWVYFHGFTLSLYVLNIFFFFHVAAILIKGQRSTEGILRTTRKQHKERVYLYLKLFVVMGITWVCEVASWQEGTCEYWIFTDIVNSLQGVMIFFIFMCNKKVFQKIQAKGMPIFRRIKDSVRSPSSEGSGVTRASNSLQRTTQTSDESSTRRLSNSTSISPSENQLSRKASAQDVTSLP